MTTTTNTSPLTGTRSTLAGVDCERGGRTFGMTNDERNPTKGQRPLEWMRFDPVEFGLLCDGLTFAQVGALTKVMLHVWQRGPLSEADVRRVAKGEADAIMDLLTQHGEGMSLDFVESAREYGEGRRKQRSEAGKASAAKRNEHPTTVERPLNERPTDVLSMSVSVSNSNSEKKERAIIVTTKLDYEGFRERCLKVHRDSAILSDAEAKAFFDYWTEGHPETKPRYATMDKFDIAKRMGTWKRNNFSAKPEVPTISPTAKPWMQ